MYVDALKVKNEKSVRTKYRNLISSARPATFGATAKNEVTEIGAP